jgi:hypothetical protein
MTMCAHIQIILFFTHLHEFEKTNEYAFHDIYIKTWAPHYFALLVTMNKLFFVDLIILPFQKLKFYKFHYLSFCSIDMYSFLIWWAKCQ